MLHNVSLVVLSAQGPISTDSSLKWPYKTVTYFVMAQENNMIV